MYKAVDARHKAGHDVPLGTMPRNRDRTAGPHTKLSPERTGQRIAKLMARAGLASRREAEAWIGAGRVAINGAVITSPAVNVGASDTVTVDGKPLPRPERTRLFLFHKPRGLVTTTSDPEGRPTIFTALPKHLPRLVTIGRLDFNTEGLLLLTNDGGLARVLEHPQTGWLRRYRVRALGSVTQAQLDTLRDGITVDGIHYGPIEATLDRVQTSNVWISFAIREGKNREVRNVLGHLGLQVARLIRVSFGPFQLAELAEGAVEEVRTRVLREQLGKKIADLAGVDFDAPVAPGEPDSSRRPPQHSERRATGEGRPAGRPSFDGKRSLRSGPPSAGRGDRASRRDRPQPEPPREDLAARKPRPWRGRGRDRPITERAQDGDAVQRKAKSGLVKDRKGRRVLVQRVQSESPPPKQSPPRERQPRKPTRNRRHGPRPSQPRGKPDKS